MAVVTGLELGRQVMNVPSFIDSQKHIDFSLTSPFGGGRPGKVKRKNKKASAKKAAGGMLMKMMKNELPVISV